MYTGWMFRLWVVSNFGDSDRGTGENTHTRARNFRGDAKRREREKWGERRVSPEFRERVCVFSPALRSLSPKLETTRSLLDVLYFTYLIGSLSFYRLLRLASCDCLNYNRPCKGGSNNCYTMGKRLPFFIHIQRFVVKAKSNFTAARNAPRAWKRANIEITSVKNMKF